MSPTADDVPTVTQFTDPMCTWCWGAEPIVRHLRVAYGDRVRFEFVMGGLVADFEAFYDARNDISTPADVIPHWEEAAAVHGMPMDTTVLAEDPPDSTHPANVAVAAARLQDRALAHRYLRRLREAYTTERVNVATREAQLDLAAAVGLDVEAFRTALEDGSARAAFERDQRRLREAGVRSFPTYRLTGPDGTRQAAGFQSFDALSELLTSVAPGLESASPPPVAEFVAAYGPVATQEVAEVYELSRGKAHQTLASLHEAGAVAVDERPDCRFWIAPDGAD